MTVIYIVSIQFVIADTFFNAGQVHMAMKNYESVRYLIAAPDHEVDPLKPIKNWMKKGEIEFENYSANFGVQLRNLNFKIRSGEKIIIIGKSGAGKSSIGHAIARIMEAETGKILIDGVDITKIGILDLREKITIIPQVPVMLKGTIRFNLDPDNKKTDEEI